MPARLDHRPDSEPTCVRSEGAQPRALAAAGRAEQGDEIAVAELERNPGERARFSGIGAFGVPDRKQRHFGGGRNRTVKADRQSISAGYSPCADMVSKKRCQRASTIAPIPSRLA